MLITLIANVISSLVRNMHTWWIPSWRHQISFPSMLEELNFGVFLVDGVDWFHTTIFIFFSLNIRSSVKSLGSLSNDISVFKEQRYNYIENNGRRNFGEIWKDEEMKYSVKYIYIYDKKTRKILRMEWWNGDQRWME